MWDPKHPTRVSPYAKHQVRFAPSAKAVTPDPPRSGAELAADRWVAEAKQQAAQRRADRHRIRIAHGLAYLRAQYAGACAHCHQRIAKDQRIVWHLASTTAYHRRCARQKWQTARALADHLLTGVADAR